ncbi:hypothetical protein JCGZ_04220 [Jatropha curcas]|uniref:Uncharacterized protein n=1 Tax=Jatropha curcas TaxID=180498 RepID=A0A067KYC1_JATCU|nr:hypothetical protein JCGZ_04220 [Jatropha curcas]
MLYGRCKLAKPGWTGLVASEVAWGILKAPAAWLGPARDGPSTGVEEEGRDVGLHLGVLAEEPEAREERVPSD